MKVEKGGQPCWITMCELFENTGNLHRQYLSDLRLQKCFDCIYSFTGVPFIV